KVRHDLVHDLLVVWPGTSAEVRISSHHHYFTHVEWKGDFNRLRKYRATFSKFSFTRVANIGAIVFDLAGLRMQQAREHLDQRRLPCSVRTDDQVQLARRKRNRDVGDQRFLPDTKGDVRCLEHGTNCV